MKLSLLLSQRRALLRQARLAGFAFAYWRLAEFAGRIDRARLHGSVHLAQMDPESGRFAATLTAMEGNQSVIDEHFTDEDVMDLADAIALKGDENASELTFPIEELRQRFLDPVRHKLEQEGVVIDPGFRPRSVNPS
jgi:hypothetical protein